MRFGGHETFAIREGWLHKGLRLLANEPHLLVDEHAADWLGVGRDMAKRRSTNADYIRRRALRSQECACYDWIMDKTVQGVVHAKPLVGNL